MPPSDSKILGNATIWDRDDAFRRGEELGPDYTSLLYPFDVVSSGALDYEVVYLFLRTIVKTINIGPDAAAALSYEVSGLELKIPIRHLDFNEYIQLDYEVTNLNLKSVYVEFDFADSGSLEYEVVAINLLQNNINLNIEDAASLDYEVTALTLEVA